METLPTKILLATDGSRDAVLATRAASDLATRSSAELHVVHAWQELPRRWYPTANAAYLSKLVVRGGEEAWPPRRIVVGDDGSDIAKSAAEMGVGIGRLLGANVLLVRAHQEHVQLEWLESLPHDEREVYEEAVEEGLRSEREDLEVRAAELAPVAGSAPKARVARGDAAKVLLEAAEENGAPSLVVVGARGLGFARRMLLGSVSTKILRAAVGPVLVCSYDRGTMSSQDTGVG